MNHAWAYAAADKQIFWAACLWLAVPPRLRTLLEKTGLQRFSNSLVGDQQRVDVIAITPH